MRNKIKCLLVVLVFLMFSTALVPIAFASDRVELDTDGDNTTPPAVYYGEKISSININSYQDVAIDLSKANLDIPLVEFVFTPSVEATADTYAPDFEELTFTFTNQVGDKMNVVLNPRNYKSGESGEYEISVNAAGPGQSLAAEWVGNAEKNKDTLGTYWAGNGGLAFDGIIHHKDGAFIYDDGTPVKKGSKMAFRLYYDLDTNGLYIDVAPASSTNSRKATSTTGGYRWCIRDFDYNGYKDNPNSFNLKPEVLWGGFKSTDTVKMGIAFGKVRADHEPSIILTKVSGKALADNPIIVETPSYGLKDTAYSVPQPMYYHSESNTEESFVGVSGQQYKVVKKADSSVVQDWTALTAASSFIPTTIGDYDISYKANSYEKTITVTVAGELPGTEITAKQVGGIIYVGDTLDLGAVCKNDNQTAVPELSCEIFKDDVSLGAPITLGSSYNYEFASQGEYKVVYSATDYLGRVVTKTLNFDVRRYYIVWQNGISYNTLQTQNVDFPAPNSHDLKLFDLINDNYVTITTCDIKLYFDGALTSNFNMEGVYTVKYNMSCTGGYDAKAERLISVYRAEMETVDVPSIPSNTKLIDGDLSDLIVNLKAVMGKAIEIPAGYFGYGVSYVNMLDPNGTLTDVTTEYNMGGYSFTPDKNGVYMLTARLDDGLYRAVKTLNFDVRTKWLSFAKQEDLTVSLGYEPESLIPELKNFYGAVVEGANLTVYYGDQKLDSDNILFDKLGKYTVCYDYRAGDEFVSGSYNIIVKDLGEPVVKLGEHEKKGRVGKFIKIAEYEVSDDSGLAPAVTVTVKLGDEVISTFNGGFIATEKGNYVVSYTATDFAGNVCVKQYTVAIKNYTDIIVIISSVAGGLIIAGGVVAIILINKKKKKGVKND